MLAHTVWFYFSRSLASVATAGREAWVRVGLAEPQAEGGWITRLSCVHLSQCWSYQFFGQDSA
ncbi:hypothetical protein IPC737_01810 [Pseudomonas aeruginosa]|nr:hypothetical protein APB28_00415 [Pseudomonas aeruginosa]RPW79221.1 hypothetical protein IPC737_01810 [Pseudomonas aeruginosa]